MSNYISLFENNKFDELKALINNNCNDALRFICVNGHIKIAKWLSSIPNINIDNDKIFHYACTYGCIEIAKLLLTIPNNNVNINVNNDCAFRVACADGHIEIAKWLLSLPNNNININNCGDYAFCYACYYGHIDIVKWLLSVPNNNININASNDFAFRYACVNNHLDLAKWLCSLDKRYMVICDDNKIVSYKIINIIDYIYENINNVYKLKEIVTCVTLSELIQCPICMDYYKNNMISLCGFHYYCIECFKKTNKKQCLMHCKNIDPIVCL